MLNIEPALLRELHQPVPRYTSYPTAADWLTLDETPYKKHLANLTGPLSLYIHIPFCEKMCLYCGCSVILNRKREREEHYVTTLLREMELVRAALPEKNCLIQLHFGGGTPTKLEGHLLSKIMEKLRTLFSFDQQAEIAIEVDPRTVYADQGAKLKLLKALGFNRISFGVQDSDERVQEAVKRRQSWTMTEETFWHAKELGFAKINIDLIYGLPLQSRASFAETTRRIVLLKPDRIALFSYAQIPWLKPHQKAIKESDLPTLEEKFAIYAAAREYFTSNGYQAIGMDHFALAEDELTLAYRNKSLTRNFQGYSVASTPEILAFGTTAISSLTKGYFQNAKEFETYISLIGQGVLPIQRGRLLTEEDQKRKTIIHQLMCHFELKKTEELTTYLQPIRDQLDLFEKKGLLLNREDKIEVTPLGELFIRNIATLFDSYRQEKQQTTFSKSI